MLVGNLHGVVHTQAATAFLNTVSEALRRQMRKRNVTSVVAPGRACRLRVTHSGQGRFKLLEVIAC